ncbi:MAG TPA: histidine kinase [Chitinophagaceae bacterium]|nr:histidine kinase [Chitinophagaceae bacterium]
MNGMYETPFIFSPKYRLLRHLLFWTVHVIIFSFLFRERRVSLELQLIVTTAWVLMIIIYSYPLMYWIIPRILLKEKYWQFAVIMLAWGVLGYFWNHVCRTYVSIPLQEALDFKNINRNKWAPGSFLTIATMTGFGSMIVLFKYWIRKQREFLVAEKERTQAELQLLKAQIHPHFLFNTLNNIYSYSLKNSAQTSKMILRLSSLLSYILYDCKSNEVMLDREIEAMKNYIDLEKERYANRLEISINVEGDTKGRYIAPLLLLPFLENAFKHGTSEQLDKPWLSMDISVKQNTMWCKIVNSKNESVKINENGIGISNVRTRLSYLYPNNHELKLVDEGNFFVVSLVVELKQAIVSGLAVSQSSTLVSEKEVV